MKCLVSSLLLTVDSVLLHLSDLCRSAPFLLRVLLHFSSKCDRVYTLVYDKRVVSEPF